MATVRQATPADVPSVPPTPSAGTKVPSCEIEPRFEALLRHVQANRPSEDVSLIRKAWEFCVKHHEGQMRAS